MTPAKITYLIGSLATGGAEGQLIELLRKLDRSRFQPSLVLVDDAASYRAVGLVGEVRTLGIASGGYSKSHLKGLKAGGAVLRLSRHLARIRPQILHAFLPEACILAVAATRLVRVPVLIGGRRSLVDSYRTARLLASVDHLATRMCDFVIGNSGAVSEELMRIDGLAADRVATIYNGVDTQRFKPGDRHLRTAYGWTDDHVVFGTIGNFFPYKRHIDFVRAAEIISAQAPQARFIMAGEDRGTLGAIRQEIGRSGLQSRFVIVPGTPEPEKLYRAMDAYICTSATEGFSNVLLEAAASGLPIIATRTGGNSEAVFPGENGLLVPAGRAEEIAKAALTLLNNPMLRLQMGDRSRELVELRFSLDTMVHEHERFYERALTAYLEGRHIGRAPGRISQRSCP